MVELVLSAEEGQAKDTHSVRKESLSTLTTVLGEQQQEGQSHSRALLLKSIEIFSS